VAKVLHTDHSRMLTLLKVEATDLPVPAAHPKSEVVVGQWALALGRALDPNTEHPPSLSAGDSQARLLRDGAVVFEGKIGSLRRFKDDVSEVKTGFECGIGFDKYNDLKIGDTIEVFTMERIAVTA